MGNLRIVYAFGSLEDMALHFDQMAKNAEQQTTRPRMTIKVRASYRGEQIAWQRAAHTVRQSKIEVDPLRKALEDLVARCDGKEGVMANGANIDTLAAHVALGNLSPDEAEEAADDGQTELRKAALNHRGEP